MQYHNQAANQICYHKYPVHLVVLYAGFVAFARVVFNAVVATQYNAGYQPRHLLGFYIWR